MKIKKTNLDGFYTKSEKATVYTLASCELKATEVHNLIRGLTKPYPGAFTFFEGRKLFIWLFEVITTVIKGTPGHVCFRRDNGVVVVARDRALMIKDVQLEGESIKNSNEVFKKLGEYLG